MDFQSLDQKVKSSLLEYMKTRYQTPEEYIISKFKDRDIVFLGEWHLIRHDPELLRRLSADKD